MSRATASLYPGFSSRDNFIMPDYLDEIATYISECNFQDIPPEVINRARETIADTLAVIANGAQEDEVKALTARMWVPGAPEIATLIGAGIRTEPLNASQQFPILHCFGYHPGLL